MKRLFAFIAVATIAAMSAAQTIYDFMPGARQGDVQSMYNLGVCYENGYGCSPNPSQAVYWYEKAATAGMPEACVNLGYCYEKGIGTKQSYAQAAYYYMEAALKGNPGGQANVAYCFLNGWGCTKSLDSAEKFANLALNNPQSGSREISDARNCLAEIKKARAAEDDDDWFIPAQPKVAAKDLPLSELKAKAEQGDAEAQYNLGYRYFSGKGVSKDYNKAAYWLDKVARQGNATAQSALGNCYNKLKDYNKAVYWYTKAAEQGDATAQCNLGYSYYFGKGVAKDINKAKYWYTKAAEQRNGTAELALMTLFDE